MANVKEIKSRIKSISDTQKITNAMYMISSTKVRRARIELYKTRPYFRAIRQEIKRIFRTAGDVESRYFYPANGRRLPKGTNACLVITADKGFAGSYNQNVLKEAIRLLDDENDTKLFVVGEYGRQFFEQRGLPVEHSFLYTAQNPTMYRAREISSILLDLFETGKVNKIFVVYTDYLNGMAAEVVSTRLLPFHRKQFLTRTNEQRVSAPFEFFPSISTVLDNMIPEYISGFLYGALVNSFCSEQTARMNAMDAANENADKILGDLSMQYHRVRQAFITQEITEVSAGANAQKRGKETRNEHR